MILIDEEMFQARPCRCQCEQFAVRQVHFPVEIEVYAMGVAERHAWLQVLKAKYTSIISLQPAFKPQFLDDVTDSGCLNIGQGGEIPSGRTPFNVASHIRDSRESDPEE